MAPNWEKLPNITHNGFAGREFEAVNRFFEHYGLEPPSHPLLQPEFSNPMFLHLVCQGAQENSLRALPVGHQGLTAIIKLFLSAKNKRLARALDYDEREERVQKAIQALAASMAEKKSRSLPLVDAKACVDALYPSNGRSGSFFSHLERESLVTAVPTPSAAFGDQPKYSVRFTFERVADHLIIAHLLDCITRKELAASFKLDGPLNFCVKDDAAASENRGLLEALAIYLPERYNLELEEVTDSVDRTTIVLPAILDGLLWREDSSLSDKTRELIYEALGHEETAYKAAEMLFSLALRPGSQLNANFVDSLISRRPITARDPFWASVLHKSFESSGIVNRLIDWSLRSDLKRISSETAELWSLVLAWFCLAPDRRVRDRATKGLVCIGFAHPQVPHNIVKRFIHCNDEYVVERVLVAAYGVFLLRGDGVGLKETASVLWDQYFEPQAGPPLNASIRDHARLILELAQDR
ncbi:MAG: hypothetical protein IIA09_18555, partial [Proteobacteria bacterium]|nr:hypothetical protein [Pseudomonadota bacterium]